MSPVVRFGTDSSVELDLAAGSLTAICGTPRGAGLSEAGAAIVAALTDPVNYPPLWRSLTPGDRVVVALGPGTPQAKEIVRALVGYLIEHGVSADGISVLQSPLDVEAGLTDLGSGFPPEWRDRVKIEIHDPNHRERLAYLAADESGEPILLNRAIVDADVLLPIGVMSRRKEAGRFGIHSAVYPTFSDLRTQQAFLTRGALDSQGKVKRQRVEQVHEVGWLLGISFTVQVVPGPGDSLLGVVAGEPEAAARQARELYRQQWQCRVPGQAELVVAAIEGGPMQQTWANLGHALSAAAGLVEEGGAIAVCSAIAAPPGPAVQRLAGAHSPAAALRQVQRERLADVLTARQLVAAQERAEVFLLSNLDASILEELEIVPIADTAELTRLVHRRASWILLANAPLAMVELDQRESP